MADHLLLIGGYAATCNICDSDLARGVCLRCSQRRSIGLVQKRCDSCSELFTRDENARHLFAENETRCDGCVGKQMVAVIEATRMLRPVRAA